MKDQSRIQLGKCNLEELVNNLCFDLRYTIGIKCYLCRLNKCLENMADSLFGWENRQNS
jgi:hypothetical protein